MAERREDLGCCEYINSKGRKSHLLKLFCECNELDEYAESLISYTGESKSSSQERSTMLKVLTTIEDKLCRIPFPGGAQKVSKYFLLPSISLPLLQFGIPSVFQNIILSFILYWILLIGLLITWYMRYRRTTIFFFSITILQIIQLSVYEYYLIGILQMPKVISFNENFVFILLFFTCVILVFRIKRTSSKSLISNPIRDSTYCKICAAYVPNRDHHCIWLDACVSQKNKLSFYALLILSVIYLIDYSLLGLSYICQSFYTHSNSVLLPSSNCKLHDFSNQMIFLSCLNSIVICVPMVGLCGFRCTKSLII